MLEINDLTFSFGNFEVLRDVSLKLAKGEIGTLIGSSGSGKTTLFKVLTGLLTPDNGSISIAGSKQREISSQVAYMTQDDLLLPWRNILDNIMIVSELGKQNCDKDVVREEAVYYLNEVGLQGWEEAFPRHLSGGMRQRASLARAILQKRPLLLLDEPFASLDVVLREQMHRLLHEVRDRYGTTILMVTHDFRDGIILSDRIFLLSGGKIGQEWKVDEILRNDPQALHVLNEQLFAGLKTAMKAL